jgi:hypothetical protein
MSKPSAKQPPVIERRYVTQEDACREAIMSLVKGKGLPDKSGPADAKEVNGRAAKMEHSA